MPKTQTRVVAAHLPTPLAEKIDQIAERLERSRGSIVKQAGSAWIAQEEEPDRLTHEALADGDGGRIIEYQAVDVWADSLSTGKPLPAPVSRPAAARAVQLLTKPSAKLVTHPRIGERLFPFEPREIRRLLVGPYEMRYEIQGETIYVQRLWQTREDRKH